MLKVRATYVDKKELDEFVEALEEKGYNILNKSDGYKQNRRDSESKYISCYLDIEKKK